MSDALSLIDYQIVSKCVKHYIHCIMHAMIMQSKQTRMQEIPVKTDHAKVHFNEQGTPVADDFDDVYFSNDSGIDETMHVFMAANRLPARWLTHQHSHFVIAETGFGTGLNCLVAMQAFAEFRKNNPNHPLKRLYIISTEKFPLQKEDLQAALAHFKAVAKPADALLAQYPCALSGCHRLQLNSFDTTLDIWMGDIHASLPQWHAPLHGLVDAWFLDGFAPSKNPDMWTDALFEQMARLSKKETTFATFTAAGIVKRGLQDAGFDIQKVKGFGRKREMLAGHYAGCKQQDASRFPRDWPYARFEAAPLTTDSHVAVVGGGLAGAASALALVSRGIRVTLITRAGILADGASGNPQGGFYPQLHATPSPASQIQAHSFLYARRAYQQLAAHYAYPHQWCGVLQMDFTDEVAARHQKLTDNQYWPAALIQKIDARQASEIAGIPLTCGGIFTAEGGWLSPPDLVEAMIKQAKDSTLLTVLTDHAVSQIESADAVTLHIEHLEAPLSFDHVVLATGADSVSSLLSDVLPLRPVRGQVEAMPADGTTPGKLQTVLCHKGYLTPQTDGRQALGSTYVKGDMNTEVRANETQQNIETHKKALNSQSWVEDIQTDGVARAAIRLGLPDHQVVCGSLPATLEQQPAWRELAKGKRLSTMPRPPAHRIHVLTGLGSRGLTTAPLMADVLASQLCHHPLPLPEALLQAISPQRFIIRNAIRNQNDN